MKFEEITAEEFRKYADTSPYKSFMQTPEIAALRQKSGWTPVYLAVKKGKDILAAALLVSKPAFLKKRYFYAPGGPLMDLEDVILVDYFFENLKKYIKKQNGYVLHIDPYYELIERDIEGEIVKDGFNHQKALENLKKQGFKEIKHSSQPKYMFATPVKNRTESELMLSFKQNHRYYIRKAEKLGVTIRELNRDELGEFKKITESTSERRHFADRSLPYYETMYDLFHDRGEVKFMVAEAVVGNDSFETIRDNGSEPSEEPHDDGRDEARRETTVPTILSAAMFMTYGDEVVYLFSGSYEEYMHKYNAQYLIQYHMIKYAMEHHFKRYNFYGIQGLPDINSKEYGLYHFKKGFGGHVIELIGSFELSLSKTYTLAKKIRH